MHISHTWTLTTVVAGLLVGAAACGKDESSTGSREAPSTAGAGAMAGAAAQPPTPAAGSDAPAGGDQFGNPDMMRPVPLTPPTTGRPAGDDEVCEAARQLTNPVTPDILIVLDRSGSMQQERRWVPSVDAVRAVTAELATEIRFGLALFPMQEGQSGDNGGRACTPGDVVVPIGDDTAGAIAMTLDSAFSQGGTPTAETLEAVARTFGEIEVNPDVEPNPRYVLLVTDGQPTCPAGMGSETLPADVERSYTAIDALTQAGVRTYVIGYDTTGPQNTDLATVLDGFAQRGGTGDTMHRPVEDSQSLIDELRRITAAVVSCNLSLEEAPPRPDHVQVLIDGQQIDLNDPDGWQMEGDKTIRLVGAACERMTDGGQHILDVTVQCEAVVPG